jgi:hypothetical protein
MSAKAPARSFVKEHDFCALSCVNSTTVLHQQIKNLGGYSALLHTNFGMACNTEIHQPARR